MFALTVLTSICRADLNWGGGAARYYDIGSSPLTETTGLAVLVSVHSGQLIAYRRFLPADPTDLITPGAALSDGQGNQNIVLATSDDFTSGYLMNSLVKPDVARAVMESYGVAAGEILYLICWDVTTFVSGEPAGGSKFVVHQLFVEGASGTPAQTYGTVLPGLPTQIMGDSAVASYTCSTVVDTEPPVITVTPDAVNLEYGAAAPALTAGVTALDDRDGDISGLVSAGGTVNTWALGQYVITYDVQDKAGNAATQKTRTYTVGKCNLTVTADDKSRTYGAANPALTIGYSGFVGGDDEGDLDQAPTATCPATVTSPPGDYTITPSGGTDDHYAFSYVTGTLTVSKAPLTATAEDEARAYGVTNPALTIAYSGFVNGEDASVLDEPPVASTAAVADSPPGDYTIAVTGGSDGNYALTRVDGTLTISKAPQTITFDALPGKTYGDVPFALAATSSSGLSVTYASLDDTVATVSGNTVTIVGAGAATIRASQAGNTNYLAAPDVDRTLTVAKKLLTVTAEDKGRTYGAANPAFTVQYNGWVGGDGPGDLATPPTATCPATAASPAGEYTITPSDGTDEDYTFNYVTATLTVTQALLTATAETMARVYGVANPLLTIAYSGFVNGEDVGVMDEAPTASTTADLDSPPGDYTITVTGGSDGNYALTRVNGTLTISKASQTVTFDALPGKAYGDAPFVLTASASSNLEVAYASLDESVATVSGSTVTIVGAGTATIHASQAGNGNYLAAPDVDRTLTVAKKTLTVTADGKFRAYGEANPAFTVQYSGWVGGDGPGDLATPPTASCPATVTSPVGNYTITPSGGADEDYAFSYVTGTLTVSKAPLTATAEDKARAYGEANPALTIAYAGFVNGEDAGVLDTPPTASTTAVLDSPPGAYTITVTGGSDGNYALTRVNGTLTISKASQTITFDALPGRTYGEAPFGLTATASSGLEVTYVALGESVATVDGSTVTIVGAGTATIRAAQAGNGNYLAAADVDRTLTVAKQQLTVTADGKIRAYGAANPAFTVQYSGWVSADGPSDLATPPTATCPATATNPAGAYAITPGGGADEDYTFSYVTGTLNVTQAPLTATAEDKSRVYGVANPTLTIAYAGFVNGEDASVLDTPPTASTTAVLDSPPGDYTITVTGGSDGNYALTRVNGTLTISKASQTITFDALPGRTYGEAPFGLTATASSGLSVAYTSLDECVATVSGSTVTIVGAGTATIRASQAGNANYLAAPDVDRTFTVSRKSLTATAENMSRAYGTANPSLTVAYSGFLNGEDQSVLDEPPVASTTATLGSPPGVYPITLTGGAAANYEFTLVDGVLTIAQAQQTIDFPELAQHTYGDPDFDLQATASSGLTVSYGNSNPDVATVSGNTVTIVGAGQTTITASQVGDDRYAPAADVAHVVTVNRKPVEVTAEDRQRPYGSGNPPFTIAYSGLVAGDTVADIDAAPVPTCDALPNSLPGQYAIVLPHEGTDNNYVITAWHDGILTVVNGAPIIVQQGPLVVAMDEDSAPTPWAAPLLSATDDGAGVLVWSISVEPSHGAAHLAGTGTSPTAFSYTPVANWYGTDSFRVQVTDGYGGADSIQVNVTVSPRNDPPVNTVPPSVSGPRWVGAELAAVPGEWNDDLDTVGRARSTLSFTYQWRRAQDAAGTGAYDIPDATSSSYRLANVDDSMCVQVVVTATDNGVGLPNHQSATASSGWVRIAQVLFSVDLKESGQIQASLAFGQTPAATEGVDDGLDVVAPAREPGKPYAYWVVAVGDAGQLELHDDFRAMTLPARWRLVVELAEARGGAVELAWDVTGADADKTLLLQELDRERPIGAPLDMTESGGVTVTHDSVFEVAYAVTASSSISVAVGWSLLGVPVMTTMDMRDAFVDRLSGQPLKVGTAWVWRGQRFQSVADDEPLNPERGYWVYSPTAGNTRDMPGIPADGRIRLRPGWNLISPVANTVLPRHPAFRGPAWFWSTEDGEYRAVWAGERMEPGKGYWIDVTGDQDVVLETGE